ncbi:hypothetical protein AB0D14_37495 [Streptomyces sp. NPDC048484]|uniref:hypothetical protein n=1 Tax=Streptomyces sp. NPDC048484 TaxID=3155146 RepID=UPI003421E34F
MNPPEQHGIASGQEAPAKPEKTFHGRHDVPCLFSEAEGKPAFEWTTTLVAEEGAGANARLLVQPWLTISRWPGNVDAAARVADKLVDNAVRHGRPFDDGRVSLHLIVAADSGELFIEVDDAYPEFPGFDEAAGQSGKARGTPKGLWWVAHYRGRLAWGVKRGVGDVMAGKTVQAVLPLA